MSLYPFWWQVNVGSGNGLVPSGNLYIIFINIQFISSSSLSLLLSLQLSFFILFFMPSLLLLSLLPLSLFLSLTLLVTACRFHMCQCSDNCYLLCNTTHANDRKYITSAVLFHLKCKNQFGSMHPREGNALPITTKPQDTAKLASNLWSDNLLYPCLSHFCWCHFIKRRHISVIASTIWLFFQQLVQANNKEITKARHNWSCVRGNQPVR